MFICISFFLAQASVSGQNGPDISDGQIDNTELSDDGMLIGFVIPYGSRWLQEASFLMEAKAMELGYEYMSFQSNSDLAEYELQIEKLISLGADVIITRKDYNFPIEIAALKKASEAGIKIISFDMFFELLEYCDYNITYKFNKIGEMQADIIIHGLDLDNTDSQKNVILFAGSATDNMASVLFDAAMEKLNVYIDSGTLVVLGSHPHSSKSKNFMDICIESWSPDEAKKRMVHLLETELYDTSIDAVLCPNDTLAMGIISAFMDFEFMEYPIITAMDASAEAVRQVRDRKLSMTVLKSIKKLSESAILLADALLNDRAPDIPESENGVITDGTHELPSVLLYPEIVTWDNYREVLIESGEMTENELEGSLQIYK